jgi:hypothetical protein
MPPTLALGNLQGPSSHLVLSRPPLRTKSPCLVALWSLVLLFAPVSVLGFILYRLAHCDRFLIHQ